MLSKRSLALLFMLISCASCASAQDEATTASDEVIGGTPARGRDPAVVAVITPYQLCTGTLVAPDIVLTARHCVARTTGCPPPESLQWNPVLPQEPANIAVTTAEAASSSETTLVTAREVVFPEPFRCEEDIAAVLLTEPVANAAVLPIAERAPQAGSLVRVVGYGITESGGQGEKRVRSALRITSVGTGTFRTGEGACSGDSGGPAIDEQSGEIAGVLSNGSHSCIGDDAFSTYTTAAPFRFLIERAAALR